MLSCKYLAVFSRCLVNKYFLTVSSRCLLDGGDVKAADVVEGEKDGVMVT